MCVHFVLDKEKAASLSHYVDVGMTNTVKDIEPVVSESSQAWRAVLCISLLIDSKAI
jgi:hypothetical protein